MGYRNNSYNPMTWIWQHSDWPRFIWDEAALKSFEDRFLKGSGQLIGAWRHLDDDDRTELRVDLLSDEAIKTSAIEGEFLDRDSVQSSVRRQFGLATDHRRSSPAEAGVAEMMVALYQDFDHPLDHETMHGWHRMLMNDRRDLAMIGDYRHHAEPMQVISGPDYKPKIHFEAPPSGQMHAEMNAFIAWFRHSTGHGALTRAGIAHLYFVCIHPYEDGNGRIARALAEKALAQSIGQPSLIALSQTIERHRGAYYDALEAANKSLGITDWLVWFAETVLEAQTRSEHRLIRLIDKTRMLDRLRGHLNTRQEKVLTRLFRAEPDGFEGGLSAANYKSITGAPTSTATRDLADLVKIGALRRTGTRRYTRYWLDVPPL